MPIGANVSDPIYCPVCEGFGPPSATIAHIWVCGVCGAALTLRADGKIVRATLADTDRLPEGDRRRLFYCDGHLTMN